MSSQKDFLCNLKLIFYSLFLYSLACAHKHRMMTKHAQNRKRFGRRNFKQRYFRLTTQSLSYAKAKGKRPICDIPLTELVAVERLEEKSFKLQNIIRVSSSIIWSFNVCHYLRYYINLIIKITHVRESRVCQFLWSDHLLPSAILFNYAP